jgi:hypothetical protein
MLKKLLIGFVFVVVVAVPYMHDLNATGIITTSNAAELGLASQTNNERGIKVVVTPRNLSNEAQSWDFEVTLETHTQTLNDDLAKSSALIANGKRYVPLAWEGAPPGGHHRKGLLRFKAIIPQPPSVELQIRLAGETTPRSFKWLLK